MAATRPSVTLKRDSDRFISVLFYAALEWFLIFLLILDALLSYIATKFASSFKLQTPCLLCSRLDHILGGEKPGFYRDLICDIHRSEISSLGYCRIHDKLSDACEMCETCLFSFSAKNKSYSETYRLLVEKLGIDLGCHVEEDNKIHRKIPATIDRDSLKMSLNFEMDSHNSSNPSLGVRHCSCCDELLKGKPYLLGLLQTRSAGTDRFKKKEKSSASSTVPHVANRGFDPLSHIGYTQLKISSDTESEVHFSDEDNQSDYVRQSDEVKEEPLPHSFPEPETALVDFGLEKPNPQSSLVPDPLVPFELISPMGVSSSATIVEAPVEESEDKCVTEIGKTENYCCDILLNSTNDSSETLKAENGSKPSELGWKTSEIIDEPSSSVPKTMDLNDAYMLAVGNRGRQNSDIITELTGKESKIYEDLKLLLSQLSASRGLELPLNETGTKMHGNGDDLKVSDATSLIGLKILSKRISIERNESGVESFEGSIVSEIEGESVVERLKRQIELDRKSMNTLYKELEEERNASTVAANQAMAMITRLQEEKAMMQMEALQYQRMMEEQAEYDQELLQKSKELLAQKEKEIQGMEAELECYRKRFEQVSEEGERAKPCNCTNVWSNSPVIKKSKDGSLPDTPAFREESVVNVTQVDKAWQTEMVFGGCGEAKTGVLKNSLLEFEDEKLYLLERLKSLEKKLHLFANNGVDDDMSREDADRGDDLPDKNSEMVLRGFPLNLGENQILSKAKDTGNVGCRRVPCAKTDGSQFSEEQNHDHDWQNVSMIGRETNLISIENEVSDLNERLRVLEADRDFLEHAINSLRNGSEGVQFIQEIARHLRELRSVEIRRTELTGS